MKHTPKSAQPTIGQYLVFALLIIGVFGGVATAILTLTGGQ